MDLPRREGVSMDSNENDKEKQAQIEEIMAIRNAGNITQAEEKLTEILQKNPEDADYLTVLGWFYFTCGRFNEAEKILDEVIKLDPALLDSHSILGFVYDQQGRFEEAREKFEYVLRQTPTDLDILHCLGDVLAKLGHFEEAQIIYKKMIEQNPESPLAYCTLGELYIRLGRYQDAEEMLRKHLEIDPSATETLRCLGKSLLYQLKYQEAEDAFKRVIEINPKSGFGWSALGGLYHEMGHTRDAVKALSKGVEVDNDHVIGWIQLAGVLFDNKDTIPQAEQVARRGIQMIEERSPNWEIPAPLGDSLMSGFIEVLLMILSDALYVQGKYSEAQPVLERYLISNPLEASVWIRLGAIYFFLGEFEKGENAWKRAKELDQTFDYEIELNDKQEVRIQDIQKIMEQNAHIIRQNDYLIAQVQSLSDNVAYIMQIAGESYESIGKVQLVLQSLETKQDDLSKYAKNLLQLGYAILRQVQLGQRSQEDGLSEISNEIAIICQKLGIGRSKWDTIKKKVKEKGVGMGSGAALWMVIKAGLNLIGLPI